MAAISAEIRLLAELAAAEQSNKEFSSKLNKSSNTVENHRAWVIEPIGARSVAELLRIALQINKLV